MLTYNPYKNNSHSLTDDNSFDCQCNKKSLQKMITWDATYGVNLSVFTFRIYFVIELICSLVFSIDRKHR